jgi:hypothetical protein
LKIQAVQIQIGDRVVAYCNNRMQICTVKQILDPDLNIITLSVSTSENSRNSIARVIRFQREALVELHAHSPNRPESNTESEVICASPQATV